MLKRAVSIAATASFLILGLPALAHAAPVRVAKPSSTSSCTGGGTYIGTVGGSLTNGYLSAGFCKYGGRGISTANDQYDRYTGTPGTIAVYFSWEFTNSAGSTIDNRKPYSTARYVAAGQTVTGQGSYSTPGALPYYASDNCVRGVMQSGGQVYTTRVLCY